MEDCSLDRLQSYDGVAIRLVLLTVMQLPSTDEVYPEPPSQGLMISVVNDGVVQGDGREGHGINLSDALIFYGLRMT